MGISSVAGASAFQAAQTTLQATHQADSDLGVQSGKPDHDHDADDKMVTASPSASPKAAPAFGGIGHNLNVFA